jgi:ribonuclease PH
LPRPDRPGIAPAMATPKRPASASARGAREDGRAPSEFRPTQIVPGYLQHAEGSALITCGATQVLCAVSLEDRVPDFLRGSGRGWLTAEYSMLPSAGQPRKPREGRTGRPLDGRTQEIQRMVGRALRCSLDLAMLPEVTLWVDCDVLAADGGTRTTAINGAAVALYDALLWMEEQRHLKQWPLRGLVSATSVGLVHDQIVADLDYQEDSVAGVDLNVACASDGRLIEVGGAAEAKPFTVEQFQGMLALAQKGCAQVLAVQQKTLGI